MYFRKNKVDDRRSTSNSIDFTGVVGKHSRNGENDGYVDRHNGIENENILSDYYESSTMPLKRNIPVSVAPSSTTTRPEAVGTSDVPPIPVPQIPPHPVFHDDANEFHDYGSIGHSVKPRSLLDEIRGVLAQSYLMFLVADLRHMSATGRIGTKFDYLAIDSDLCRRDTAKRIACLSDNEKDDDSKQIGFVRGLSPAIIMAIVILEIRDTAVKNAEEKAKKKNEKKYRYKTSVDIDDDDQFVAYQNNEEKRKMTEESMESLMRCYARMVSEDLVTELPTVRRRRAAHHRPTMVSGGGIGGSSSSVVSPTGAKASSSSESARTTKVSFASPLSRARIRRHISEPARSTIYTLDPVEEEKKNSSGFKVEPGSSSDAKVDANGKYDISGAVDTDQKTATAFVSNTTAISSKIDEGSATSEGSGRASMLQLFSPNKRSRADLGNGQLHSQASFRDHIKATAENSRKIADRIKTDLNQRADSLADNLLSSNHEAKTQKEFQELTDVFFDDRIVTEEFKSTLGEKYSRKEMVDIMRSAVEERNDNLLKFMSKLFKHGSVSKLMVESEARVVWVNDWYPMKDLTYAISVDRLQRRVMVVFRGAITAEDWKSAIRFRFYKMRNPVKDDYEGKKEILRVFSGLYTYLFRKRKDTGTTKYDEIANMVHKYGTERIGPDYQLVVTGHSLGGALTHFFSFFASTEERFTKYGPVKAIAFASPYIGGHSWADSIRHQERMKRLQILQVRNSNDLVPRLPPNFWIGKRGPLWRHVGIGVTLPTLPKCGTKWKPLVHYWGKEKSCFQSTIHMYKRNFVFYFPYWRPWVMNRNHTLFELQDRLMYGEVSSKSKYFELLESTLDELYEKLEETGFQTLSKTKQWGLHLIKEKFETKSASIK